MICLKVTVWGRRQQRVNTHNETAAHEGKHWVELPPTPDASLTGQAYAQHVRQLKVRCRWCGKQGDLHRWGYFLEASCPNPGGGEQ